MWEYEVCMGYGCEVGGTGLGIGVWSMGWCMCRVYGVRGACVGCMG